MGKFKYIEVCEKSGIPFVPGMLVFRREVTGITKSEIQMMQENLEDKFPPKSYAHCLLTTPKPYGEVGLMMKEASHAN